MWYSQVLYLYLYFVAQSMHYIHRYSCTYKYVQLHVNTQINGRPPSRLTKLNYSHTHACTYVCTYVDLHIQATHSRNSMQAISKQTRKQFHFCFVFLPFFFYGAVLAIIAINKQMCRPCGGSGMCRRRKKTLPYVYVCVHEYICIYMCMYVCTCSKHRQLVVDVDSANVCVSLELFPTNAVSLLPSDPLPHQ